MADLSRRGILGALICSPAIVRASSLMPVKVLGDYSVGLYAQLTAITRQAYVPMKTIDLYWSEPLFREMMVKTTEENNFSSSQAVFEALNAMAN